MLKEDVSKIDDEFEEINPRKKNIYTLDLTQGELAALWTLCESYEALLKTLTKVTGKDALSVLADKPNAKAAVARMPEKLKNLRRQHPSDWPPDSDDPE